MLKLHDFGRLHCKALDRLFGETPPDFVRLIRKTMDDASVTPSQIEQALRRIWVAGNTPTPPPEERPTFPKPKRARSDLPPAAYAETHHTEGKPNEVLEIYRALDRFCQELAPGRVTRTYQSKTVNWTLDKAIFCCAHLQQGGLRVWVKTDPKTLDPSASFARDVSRIGHWGGGSKQSLVFNSENLTYREMTDEDGH